MLRQRKGGGKVIKLQQDNEQQKEAASSDSVEIYINNSNNENDENNDNNNNNNKNPVITRYYDNKNKTTTTAAAIQSRTSTLSSMNSSSSSNNNNDDQEETTTMKNYADISRCNNNKFSSLLAITIHIICFILLLVGIYLTYHILYTSYECDMTWSRRQFIQIPTTIIQHHTKKYNLYKFMDQRDPRQKKLLKIKQINDNNNNNIDWCLRDNPQSQSHVIILYVPGHFGSYEQSRSLGAHGTQFTLRSNNNHDRQIIQTLLTMQNGKKNNNNNNNSTILLNDFFYDVYAIDFQEEGGAFHSNILYRQAYYIHLAIQTIANACSNDNNNNFYMMIVAHSIGGISTRLALSIYTDTTNVIRNVITLGTPHLKPILTYEPGMYRLYQKLQQNNNNDNNNDIVYISISGGLRDEMIPPEVCYYNDNNNNNNNNTLSLHAIDIMKSPINEGIKLPLLGMDHRAIVWCHNLLSSIRSMFIYQLYYEHRYNEMSSVNKRIEILKQTLTKNDKTYNKYDASTYNFQNTANNFRQTLKVEYGYWTGLVMETALLYNTEILINLYAIIGACRYIIETSPPTLQRKSLLSSLPPIIATAFQYKMLTGPPTPSLLSIIILAFSADTVFLLVRTLFRLIPLGGLTRLCSAALKSTLFIGTFCGVLILLMPLQQGRILTILLLTTLVVLGLSAVSQSSTLSSQPDQVTNYVVWSFVMFPCLVLGDLVLLLFDDSTLATPWMVPVITIPMIVRYALTIVDRRKFGKQESSKKSSTLFFYFRVLVIIITSWQSLTDSFLVLYFHPWSLMLVVIALIDSIDMLRV